jgi:hypothetical protein
VPLLDRAQRGRLRILHTAGEAPAKLMRTFRIGKNAFYRAIANDYKVPDNLLDGMWTTFPAASLLVGHSRRCRSQVPHEERAG